MSTAIKVVAANLNEVLRRIGDGDTNIQIAMWLGISERMFRKAKAELKIPQQRLLRPIGMSWDDIEYIAGKVEFCTHKELAQEFNCCEATISRAVRLAKLQGRVKQIHAELERVPMAQVYNCPRGVKKPVLVTLKNKPAFVLVPIDQWNPETAGPTKQLLDSLRDRTKRTKQKPLPIDEPPASTKYERPKSANKHLALHSAW